MDNALIDDRRIHVDFSQSVSKLWNQYRRKGSQAGTGAKGCFKCGSLDHIAKDCSGSPDAKQPPKYILKDDGFLRNGGNDSSRYDMVFDEDADASPQRKKQLRHPEVDDHQEQRKTSHRIVDETKQNDNKHKDSVDGRRKEHRQDDRHHTPRGRKDYKRDELDYRTSRNDDRHGGRSDYRRRDSRDESYGRKRYSEDENDRRKVSDKDDRRYSRDESDSRKIRSDEMRHNKRSKGEDRDRVKSSTRYDDRDRNRRD